MAFSPFSDVPLAPPDPILGLTEAFLADKNPNKVNLGVGVYQDATGKIPVLRVVREAERLWYEKEDSKSYLPIDGLAAYREQVQKLLFGADAEAVTSGRVVTAQALGGTGALKLGADFIKRFSPSAELWLSRPSWENHRALFEAAGFTVHEYPYYDPATHGLDFEGMRSTLSGLPRGAVVLLHASCHNPTGVDLDAEQWREVTRIVKERELVPFVDFAYQGFAVSIEDDAVGLRTLVNAGVPCLVASSFSKSFSLYRERVGALSIVTASAEEAKRVTSQLKRVIRTNYSNPSSHGAQVVALILSDPRLRAAWEAELTEMRERIRQMRTRFVELLGKKGVSRDFSFIERQRGMFSYSGIDTERVRKLRSDFGLYIVDSGRICVAALNDKNIDYVTDCIAKVV
ncbi:MAG: amino acid aminotransferase [Pseudomonadota bacterium]|nr:MAG: aromatic amino acid aminotransferase [Pseudomonadota bacterium]